MKELGWTVFTLGVGIGATVFSSISDKFFAITRKPFATRTICRWGRRRTLLLCVVLALLVSNLCLISDNFAVFATFQVLIGATVYGTSLTIYILREFTIYFVCLLIH